MSERGRLVPLRSLRVARMRPVLRSVISWTSPGFDPEPLRRLDLEDAEALANCGLAGLTLTIAEACDIGLPDDIAALLSERELMASVRSMMTVGAARPALTAMQAAQIPFVVIKGAAAARFYEHPTDRVYNDVDIVVPPARFGQVVELAGDAGLFPLGDEDGPRAWFDRWCREGRAVLDPAGNGLDIHHHLAPWRWGQTLRFERLRRSAHSMDFDGLQVQVAGPVQSIAVAALHVVNDLWTGSHSELTLADLVRLLNQCAPGDVLSEFYAIERLWLLKVAVDLLPPDTVPVELRRELATVRTRVRHRMQLLAMERAARTDKRALTWTLRLPVAGAAAYAFSTAVPDVDHRRRVAGTDSLAGWWVNAARRIGH